MTTAHTLTISHGISRGRETYGYIIVRLRDSADGKLYRCSGGGYDMVGTVLADWLTVNYQADLVKLTPRAFYRFGNGKTERTEDEQGALYGLSAYVDTDGNVIRVSIDGACGVESVLRIARAAGVRLTSLPSMRGATVGWIVGDLDD